MEELTFESAIKEGIDRICLGENTWNGTYWEGGIPGEYLECKQSIWRGVIRNNVRNMDMIRNVFTWLYENLVFVVIISEIYLALSIENQKIRLGFDV